MGTTLALDLASRGTPSILLEERREQPPNPRCNTTNSRSMEFFRRLGLADEIRASGLPQDHPTDVVYLTSMSGHELTRYRLPASSMAKQSDGSIDAGWPTPEPQHRISQLYLEPILHRRARETPEIDFREGCRFEGFEPIAPTGGDPGSEGLVATVTNAESGKSRQIRTRYLVGAEGARSIVRRGMGASFEGNPSVARSLSSFIRCPRLGELSAQRGGWMYRVLGENRYHRFVAIDGHDLFIYHLTLGDDDDAAEIDLSSTLAEALGTSATFELLGQVDWVARAMVADRFSEGNVFLVGDAAHIWIPMGGFGMNAGVADATNLSWKLSAAVQGWAGPELFASYEAERKPMGETVARAAVGINTDLMDAIAQADGIHDEGHFGDRARQQLGSTIAAANTTEFNSIGMQLGYYYDESPVICADGSPAPRFALGDYEVTSWPGARTPHLWLDDGRSLYDLLGSFFTLLDIGSDLDLSPLVDAAAKLGIPLDVLSLEALPIDRRHASELYGGYPLVLVRPDQHIAWRGRSLPGDSELVMRTIVGW